MTTGYNLPDGMSANDPDAPWNEPEETEEEPEGMDEWEGEPESGEEEIEMPEQAQLHCPFCGTTNFNMAITDWVIISLDPTDPNNEAEVEEHQCLECSRHFWTARREEKDYW